MTALRTFASAPAQAIYDAISTASSADDLDRLARNLWRSYGEGDLGDDDATFLGTCIDRRRTPGRASPTGHLKQAGKIVARSTARLGSRFIPRQRQRSPDRKASRDRRRMLGGSSVLPADLRCCYTEGQRAVLCIVAGEVKHHGVCDLPVDRMAALAGVCRTTVQTTLHEARRLDHISISERPQPGRKHLTNVIEVINAEWRAWLKGGPSAHGPIGSKSMKMVSTTKNKAIDDAVLDARARGVSQERGCPSKEAIEFAEELATIAGYGRGQEPKSWTQADAPHIVQAMLNELRGYVGRHMTPVQMLRCLAVDVAARRRSVGDPPQSPRYFERAVARRIDEWDQMLARPVPIPKAA